MVKIIMIILHFAPHALHYVIETIFCIYDRPAEPKTEVQEEQIQCVFGDTQASNYEDANIVGSRQAPVHLTNILVFYFEALFYILLDCALSL
jgi:hypothetical protein